MKKFNKCHDYTYIHNVSHQYMIHTGHCVYPYEGYSHVIICVLPDINSTEVRYPTSHHFVILSSMRGRRDSGECQIILPSTITATKTYQYLNPNGTTMKPTIFSSATPQEMIIGATWKKNTKRVSLYMYIKYKCEPGMLMTVFMQ